MRAATSQLNRERVDPVRKSQSFHAPRSFRRLTEDGGETC